MTKKTTKKALLMSALSLLLCFSMLIGTTFAWFTDEVKSGTNIIAAGNLDIELYHADKAVPNGEKVTSNTKLFDDVTSDLWEPGAMAYEILTVANEGTLALKYQLSINFTNATMVNNVTLADALMVAVVDVNDLETRESAIAAAKEKGEPLKTFMLPGTLEAGKDATYAIVIYWEPTDNDNMFNMIGENKGKTLSIDLGVSLVATQMTSESDSFNSNYDEDAWHNAMKVYSADDLQDALNNGETKIVLMDNIDASEPIVIPAPETATYSLRAAVQAVKINLNGMEIKNPNGYVFENYGHVVFEGNGIVSGLGCIRSHGGTIEINGGNFYASSRWQDGVYQHTLKAENTIVTINGGNFDATVNGQTNAMLNASENAVITINGGSFKNVAGELTQFDPYIFTYEKNGAVEINGGTFYGGWRFNGETTTTTITGGTFTVGFDGQSFHANSTHVVTVIGGTFTANTKLAGKLSEIMVEGYKAVDNGNGTYTVLFPQESFDELIKNPDENGNVEIPAGTYTFPCAKLNADITLNCAPGTVFEGAKLNANGATIIGATFKNTPSSNTVNGIYKNCTFTGSNGLRYGYAGETVVFENCVFSGSTYGVHFDGGANNVVFKGCTFSGFNAMGAAIKLATYENCTFVANGKSNYNGINMWGNTEMTGCTFVFDGKAGNEWIDLCSAGKYATFTNCVVTDGEKEYGVEEYVSKREDSGVITVDGKQIVHDIDALKYAVEHAASGAVIGFGADITGNVTVVEKNDVIITIDGMGHKFNGILTVNGGSARNTKNATTIQNIHFYGQTKGTDDAYIKLGGNNSIRYTDNVTVKNCVFDGDNMVAVKSYTGGDWNLIVEDCTVNNGMHSFLQLTNVEQGLKITNCKVYSKNGINLNNTPSLEMTGCIFDVTGYAVRFGVAGTTVKGEFKIEGCTLKSACNDGDAIIIFRGTVDGTTLTLKENTFVGTIQMKGHEKVTIK